MRHYGITHGQQCNKDNNYKVDNVVHASVLFEFFGGFLNVKTHDKWEGNMITRSEI
jgi:hypothetical protein